MTENFADEDALALKLQIALVGDPSHRRVGVVLHLRHAPRKRPAGSLVPARRRLIRQRFMRTLVIINVLETMKYLLLRPRIARRRPQRFLLQAAMHALMPAVVLGTGRTASLGHDSQPDPAHRQPAQSSRSPAGKGRAVIGVNHLRHSVLAT